MPSLWTWQHLATASYTLSVVQDPATSGLFMRLTRTKTSVDVLDNIWHSLMPQAAAAQCCSKCQSWSWLLCLPHNMVLEGFLPQQACCRAKSHRALGRESPATIILALCFAQPGFTSTIVS